MGYEDVESKKEKKNWLNLKRKPDHFRRKNLKVRNKNSQLRADFRVPL